MSIHRFKKFGELGWLVRTSHTASRGVSGWTTFQPRRKRHIESQMKFFSSKKFKSRYK